jgi:hypothetical protein
MVGGSRVLAESQFEKRLIVRMWSPTMPAEHYQASVNAEGSAHESITRPYGPPSKAELLLDDAARHWKGIRPNILSTRTEFTKMKSHHGLSKTYSYARLKIAPLGMAAREIRAKIINYVRGRLEPTARAVLRRSLATGGLHIRSLAVFLVLLLPHELGHSPIVPLCESPRFPWRSQWRYSASRYV